MTSLALSEIAPEDWDAGAGSAYLFTGFAEACAELGYSALYAEDARDRALVLVRGVPVPGLRRWTRRAKVFTARRDAEFLRRLSDALAARGVVHIKVGHPQHAWDGGWPSPWNGLHVERMWTAVIEDVQAPPEAFLAARRGVRANLSKARRAGVVVGDARTAHEIDAACAVMTGTEARIRDRGVNHLYPVAFVRAAWRHMVPRGQAVILAAHADGHVLAAQLYFLERDRLVYYQGGSTRDRSLTPLQGPTAVTWHAVQMARARGCAALDFGGVNPGDPAQASLTAFKRQWGRFCAGEIADIALSPRAVRLQERYLLPLWKHVHPLYTLAFGRRRRDVGA
jgi:GNAT acetyltransferase-like protein